MIQKSFYFCEYVFLDFRVKWLCVETNLTNAAGSPMIDVDQQIVIAKDSVKAAADTAKGLTASEQEAWASYLPTVDLS